ncbi:MAG: dTDP-4-dehydrorhamnose 3,5-epimerase [candidate division Zixibacteria bacterium RBG_16_53_22]|nr:MAG: dTDP-4-dehydrorhamnose 3,5-epimerase [candidate division Zixibacteria bacterium RBG_16_53_22]
MKLIEGVKTRQLKIIADERGRLAEILRSDWDIFAKVGQVYFTTAYPGVVKGWHYHKIQTDHFFCIKGMTKLVLYDSRQDSPTSGLVNEFFTGEHNPLLVVIPPLVYHGFKAISTEESIMINIPTEPYNYSDPDEYRLEAHTDKIPYNWDRKDF